MRYSEVGVDFKAMDALKKRMLLTYDVKLKGHYAPVIPIDGENYYSIHTDGVGTKMLIAEKLGIWEGVGTDVVAMNVNDMACINCSPTAGVDYIAAETQDGEVLGKIVESVAKACRSAGILLAGGETAILKGMVKGFDLSFTCVGFGKLATVIDGKSIADGDVIIGIESSGLHSNGFSLARKVLDLEEHGRQMLAPTLIYSNAVLELAKKIGIHGIAHITGGAFTKIRRLGTGFDYVLDKMPEPKGIFKPISDTIKDVKELYSVFNMGIGMVLIVCPESERQALSFLASKGMRAHTIGTVKKGSGRVFIENKIGNSAEL